MISTISSIRDDIVTSITSIFNIGNDIERESSTPTLNDEDPPRELQIVIDCPVDILTSMAHQSSALSPRPNANPPIGELEVINSTPSIAHHSLAAWSSTIRKRTRQYTAVDSYTSQNIPEIEDIIPFNGNIDSLKESTSIRGPLPLGKLRTEAHDIFERERLSSITEGVPSRYSVDGNELFDTLTNRVLLRKFDSGWIDVKSGNQVYDNKGNLPTDPIDFQMS